MLARGYNTLGRKLTQGRDIKLSPAECPACPRVAEAGKTASHIRRRAPSVAGTTASSRSIKISIGNLDDCARPIANGGSDIGGRSVSNADRIGDGECAVSVYYKLQLALPVPTV